MKRPREIKQRFVRNVKWHWCLFNLRGANKGGYLWAKVLKIVLDLISERKLYANDWAPEIMKMTIHQSIVKKIVMSIVKWCFKNERRRSLSTNLRIFWSHYGGFLKDLTKNIVSVLKDWVKNMWNHISGTATLWKSEDDYK